MKKHNKTHSINVVDIVKNDPITGVLYGTREITLQGKHSYNYYAQTFNITKQNMLHNITNQRTKKK